jgi:O-antigen ligase
MSFPAASFFLASAALAALAAIVAVYDPVISRFLPDRIWQLMLLENLPVRAPLLVALTGIVAVALFSAVLPRPRHAAIVALFAAAQMNGLRLGPIDAFDVALFLVLTGSAAALLRTKVRILVLSPVVFFAGALILVGLPHLIVEPPIRYLAGMIGLVRALLVALAVTNLIRDWTALIFALRALVAVAVANAIIGIAQFLLGYVAGIHFTLLDPPQSAWKPTPLGFVMRASGLCITAQHLSGYLSLAFPFAAWNATITWRIRDWAKVLVILTGVVVTWNLGAALVCLLVGLLFPFLRWPRFAPHFLLAIAVTTGWGWRLGALGWLIDLARQGAADKSALQRLTLLQIGIEKIAASPWVGTGPQAFASYSGNFWHRPVHNAYLQAMTELGAIGTLVIVGMLVTLSVMLLAAHRTAEPAGKTILTCSGFMLLTLALLMNSEPMLDHSNTWLFAGLIDSAIIAAAAGLSRPIARAHPQAWPPMRTTGTAARATES